MSSTMTQAAREYASRPADERYHSIPELIAAAQAERDRSKEVTYNWKDLHFTATPDNSIQIESPRAAAQMSNWSFGQMCRTLSAPASFLRDGIPAANAAADLNYRISQTAAGEKAVMLVKAPNGNPFPTVRSCTTESYGRLWDADLYSSLHTQIMSHDSRWELPPTWEGGKDGPRSGAYRGDRDSFVIITNGGSIVNDPSAGQGDAGQMFRGLLIRNSEVGACSVVIESILFRYICGNHMLWGATMDKRFRRRHIGTNVLRNVVREIGSIAFNWTNNSAAKDEAMIKEMIAREIAHTKEAVIDELRAIGATKEQAETAYDLCELKEKASPRSFWGAAQGLTRLSQQSEYQDDRYLLDQLAGKVLARAAKLVRV